MSSAVQATCKGCGGAILSPGPRITFTGMPGEYHVSCAASASADWARSDERQRVLKIASGLLPTPAYEQLRKQVESGAQSAFGN
jgi:hypothetical protein